jgi:hypothetical protein
MNAEVQYKITNKIKKNIWIYGLKLQLLIKVWNSLIWKVNAVQFCLKVTNYFNKLNGLFHDDLCEIAICFFQSQTGFKSDVN